MIEVSSNSFPSNDRLVLKKVCIPFVLFLMICVFLGKNVVLAWWLVILLFVGVLLIAVFNYYYLKVFYFTLGDKYVLIKRHGLNPQEIIIEYERIKDIVIHRDTLDRLFGLYQIRFECKLISPIARKMAYVEGLDEVEAHELKVVMEHLIEKAVR